MTYIINPFLGAGGGGRTIPVTSGLLVHLKRGVGYYTDAGSTPATSNNDLIYRWADASGNGFHADQTNSTDRPFLRTTGTTNGSADNYQGANCSYYRRGTGVGGDSDKYLEISHNFGALTAGEGFIVVKTDVCPESDQFSTGLWATASDFGTHFPYTDSHLYDGWGSTVRKDCGTVSSGAFSADFVVYDVYSASGDWQNYINNVSKFSTGTNTVSFPGANVYVGRDLSPTAFNLHGHLAEFVWFDRKLNSTERGNMYTFLST